MSHRPKPPPESILLQKTFKKSQHTLPTLAGSADVSTSTISVVFQGFKYTSSGIKPMKPTAQTAAKIAAVLRINPSKLVEAGRPDIADAMKADSDDTSAIYNAGRRDLATAILRHLSREEILRQFTTDDLYYEIDRRNSPLDQPQHPSPIVEQDGDHDD